MSGFLDVNKFYLECVIFLLLDGRTAADTIIVPPERVGRASVSNIIC
jgi:hypothetical protein